MPSALPVMPSPSFLSVHPPYVIGGGRVAIVGDGFQTDRPALPEVRLGNRRARVEFASPSRLEVRVPQDVEGGTAQVTVDGRQVDTPLEVGTTMAVGLHQVDSPVVDRLGNVFVTYSGTRGHHAPVTIFRVAAGGARENVSSGVVNPTSMALDGEGHLFVSSRFEGAVYRVLDDGTVQLFASNLGIACGLAFGPDGTLFVGDRSGTIFAVDRSGHAAVLATLPPSVVAFHLAIGRDALYVSVPTLSPSAAVYRVGFDGEVAVHSRAFGRPQGLAIGPDGTLLVVEALAGGSGLYRVPSTGAPTLALSAAGLVGVAFDRAGVLVVSSSDTLYRFARFS